MSDKITVYSYRRCPFAMRVRIALHEKDLPFEVVEEDLKNLSENLRKLHPEAKVPVLVHVDRVIYESAIINEYVDELPSSFERLMPDDSGLRAEVRLWTYWCNSQFKVDLDKFKYGTLRFVQADCEGVEEKMKVHLKKLELRLSKFSWLVGKKFSLAEVNVFPFIRQLTRIQPYPPFLVEYPQLARWVKEISERSSIQRSLLK